ncbi:hypothetical protein GGF46_000949 [Coemansia sp. RSA 552]|nr:hypothetical protein GGF46_000949 [Coemansia sp. RSA 552]
MDSRAVQALVDCLAATVAYLPVRPLPPLLSATFTQADDLAIVANGIAKARILQAQKKQRVQRAAALDQLVQAAPASGEGSALGPRAMAQVSEALKEQPGLLASVQLDDKHIRQYARNCWSVLVAIVGMVGVDQANRIIQVAIPRPMGVVEHNSLAQLLIDRIDNVSAETLFAYLNAVEASCRAQQQQQQQQQLVHNVRLALKVFNRALDANRSLAETMSIELSSFCLSHTQIKDATDLYRRIVAVRDLST